MFNHHSFIINTICEFVAVYLPLPASPSLCVCMCVCVWVWVKIWTAAVVPEVDRTDGWTDTHTDTHIHNKWLPLWHCWVPKYQCCFAPWCHSARSVENTLLFLSLSVSLSLCLSLCLSLSLSPPSHSGNTPRATCKCETEFVHKVYLTSLPIHLICVCGWTTHTLALCETHTHTHISVLWYQMACLNTVRWQTEPFPHVVTMGTHIHAHTHTHTSHPATGLVRSVLAAFHHIHIKTCVSAIQTDRQQVTMHALAIQCVPLLWTHPLHHYVPKHQWLWWQSAV